MQSILLILHVVMALALIGLILIQHGKGADAGAAFGSGASATVFGATGSGSFLTRTTAILAFVFFANSFFLSYLSTKAVDTGSLMEKVQIIENPAEKVSIKIDNKTSEEKSELPVPVEEKTGQSDLPVVPE